MKKFWFASMSCMLASSIVTGAALAKSDNAANGQGQSRGTDIQNAVNANVTSAGQKEVKQNATVTENTYGKGPQGYRGLLNAIENVQDKPAGAVIAETLLSKYEAHLSDELKAKLEQIQDRSKAVTEAVYLLEQSGNVTEAVYLQKEAVKADPEQLESYKTLGKLLDKVGKKGVKLYVNGDEPNFEVAPFIREGNTLVPFRAISEALKAEVTWNPEERSVTVVRGDVTVKLFIDSKTAFVNGKEVTLEVPAAIEAGSTVVPVRFVSEALNAKVDWESETQFVVINETK